MLEKFGLGGGGVVFYLLWRRSPTHRLQFEEESVFVPKGIYYMSGIRNGDMCTYVIKVQTTDFTHIFYEMLLCVPQIPFSAYSIIAVKTKTYKTYYTAGSQLFFHRFIYTFTVSENISKFQSRRVICFVLRTDFWKRSLYIYINTRWFQVHGKWRFYWNDTDKN